MSEVGALIVKLRAETAEFRSDMGKVQADLDSLKGKSQETGEAMDHSFTEARGGLMLTEEVVGVHLPRHLNTLIAQIPGVGAAFSTMLPLIGVIAAIAIVGKLIERHEALAAAINKAAIEAGSQAVKEADQSKQIEITNLKLDDQIAKLTHKLPRNYIKEAILESSEAIDKLAASFATDFQKMNTVIIEQTGLWERFKRGVSDAWSGVAQGKGYGTTTEALHKVQEAMMGVEQARRKLAEAPMDKDSQAAGQQALISALQKQKQAMDASMPSLKGHDELLMQMTSAASSAAVEIKNLSTMVEMGGKKKTIAGLESADEAKEAATKLIQANKAVAESVAHAMENYVAFGRAQREAYKGSNNSEALSQTEDFFKSIAEAQKKAAQEELQTAQQNFSNQAEVAKASLDQQRGAIANASELGLISRHEAVQQEIALIQRESGARLVALTQEVAAKRRAVQEEIDADNRAASNVLGANNSDKSDPKYIAFLNDATNKMAQLDAITNKYNADVKVATTTATTQVAGLNVQLAKLYPTWQQFFKEMNKDVPTLSQSIHGSLQSSVTKFNESFSQGIAKSIVEAKSLSSALKQIGREIVEDAIANFIRWKLMNAEKAGAAEFSNALAEGTPLPIAVAEGAGAFAKALAFEQGGTIPGAGAVPIIGHGGETVVTKALTDRVNAAEGRGGSAGGVHMHNTFAPQIHAVDAEGVDRLLAKHASTFQRHMVSAARKMNKR